MRRLACLALVAACGFPKLPAVGGGGGGGGDGGGSGGTLLAAIDEPYAKIGDTITLEGSFSDGLVVGFPGGVSANATLLGPHRATVVVPAGATTGRLSVGDTGATSLPFRATTFAVSLGYFDDNYHQADYARTMPQDLTSYAPTMVGDAFVYVFGGAAFGGVPAHPIAANTIGRAPINADGTLDDFAPMTQHLLTPRAFAASARIGDTTYLIGGEDDQGSYLDTIESATLKPDGTLALTTLSNKLATARFDPTCAVIGSWLYVIGGKDSTTHVLDTIERAPINSDGTLGEFAAFAGELQKTRYGASSVVYGSTLYVAGGSDGTGAQANVEQAPIAADGSLGDFVDTMGTLLTGRLDPYATIAGGALYVIGGEDGPGTGTYSSSADIGSIMPDGSISKFTNKANLLANPRGGFATARVGNYLYAIGGSMDGGGTWSTIEAASVAGNAIGTFGTAAVTSMVTSRHAHASVVIGSWLYVIGGVDDTGTPLQDVERAPIGLDGTLGLFTDLGNLLPDPRMQPSVAVMDGYLYVIGGYNATATDGSQAVAMTAINADGSLAGFSTVSVTLNYGRFGAATAVVDGYVIVFGGIEDFPGNEGVPGSDGEDGGEAGGVLAGFDLAMYDLQAPTYGATAAVVRHRYYVVLGQGPGLQSSNVTVSTSGFTMKQFLNGPTGTSRDNASSVWTGDTLFVLGGVDMNGADLSVVESGQADDLGDFAGTKLTTETALPMPLSGQTSTILGNHVYTVGGTSTGTTQGGVFGALLQ